MVFRSRVATVGLIIVVFWILVAIFAPLIAPHNPLAQDSKAINQGPSATYPLGTDKLGRDVMFAAGVRRARHPDPGADLGVFVCAGGHRYGAFRRLLGGRGG